MSEQDENSIDEMPLPPPPPGLKLPLPTPPPPSPNIDIPDIPPVPTPPPPSGIDLSDSVDSFGLIESKAEADSDDFNSAWERKKGEIPSLSSDNRDRMYGHIDRIATGEVGTLLDRFSDRFGSELDREIIVLRKKQQQDMRDIKPTVELISGPDEDFSSDLEEYEEDTEEFDETSGDEDDDSESGDIFPAFFGVVNDLLGNMPDDFVQSFLASDDFPIFQSAGANPEASSDDERREFFQMINRVLGELPEDKIKEFVNSPDFKIFQAMGELYGA